LVAVAILHFVCWLDEFGFLAAPATTTRATCM
jgi:hypothetical protein